MLLVRFAIYAIQRRVVGVIDLCLFGHVDQRCRTIDICREPWRDYTKG